MTTATPPSEANVTVLTPGRALWRAWIAWLVMLGIPFFFFVGLMWRWMLGSPEGNEAVAYGFFAGSMGWLLLAVPGAFLLRGHVFKGYWEGQTIDPASYLRGMLTIWIAIEIGGLIALIGCLASGSLLPNLLPAVAAFMLYTPFWPDGRAMTETIGGAMDDEIYREPK